MTDADPTNITLEKMVEVYNSLRIKLFYVESNYVPDGYDLLKVDVDYLDAPLLVIRTGMVEEVRRRMPFINLVEMKAEHMKPIWETLARPVQMWNPNI